MLTRVNVEINIHHPVSSTLPSDLERMMLSHVSDRR